MTAQRRGAEPHWVFGYGSLIWRPGFPYLRSERALLLGAHRSLCIYSHHHRGTPEKPGLVFGLMRGGSCHGMAFEVAAAEWDGVVDYLREREQVTKVYRETTRPVRLANGGEVRALTYVVDERHDQFAGRLPVADQLAHVRQASGGMGANVDYVLNTIRHLDEMGIADRHLAELGALLMNAAD